MTTGSRSASPSPCAPALVWRSTGFGIAPVYVKSKRVTESGMSNRGDRERWLRICMGGTLRIVVRVSQQQIHDILTSQSDETSEVKLKC